jgi:formiminotetrahydrofolate cyclodeaminase
MKKVKPGFRVSVRRTLRLLEKARKDALQVVDLDPKIYQTLLKTYRDARSLTDPARKNRLLDEALENSFRLQADLAFLITLGKKGAQSLEGMIPGSIQNDLKVSLALLQAAFHGAYETARINAVYLKNFQKRNRAERALEELKKRFGA